MKNRIKITALSLSCIMLSAVFTGCGDTDTKTAPVTSGGDSYSSAEKDSVVKEYAEESFAEVADGEMVFGEAEIAADAPAMDYSAKSPEAGEADVKTAPDISEEIPDETEVISQEIPQAGLLTAGEWNDNENWGFFQNLVNSGTISFPSYGINPTNRIEVMVCDAVEKAQINAKVELLAEDGSVIWTSITDKGGKAYLFFDENAVPKKYRVSYKDVSEEFDVTVIKQSDGQQANNDIDVMSAETLTLNADTPNYPDMEVMFIVDSTGSMSDEMLFLQSEFTAIANEIGTENTSFSINFYRDNGDEYVTKCFDFTKDISEIQKILNNERADGGGDNPEAVAEILNETITEKQWGDETVKLAFLIFDAPPHAETEETLINAVKTASEKGIRIIPVVSSNSERDTELFGRALSICTNGTYVFLTDDSGIGGSHLEPIIGDYEVEKLYDIIIRVINEYRQ